MISTDTQGNNSSQYTMVNVNDLNEISLIVLNDSIQSTSVNDYVNGIDIVSYSGKYSDYAFSLDL